MRLAWTILIAVTAIVPGFSQNQGNIWFLGVQTFIDFNCDPPAISNDGLLSPREGSSTISDSDGTLIAYSDGIEIYNRNKKRMSGWVPQGGNWLVSDQILQGTLFLPINDSVINLFSIVNDSTDSYSLFVTKIDPRLDSGRGQVTILPKKLDSNLTEKMFAIRGATDDFWWLLVHKTMSKEFVRLKIKEDGVIDYTTVSVGHSILTSDGVQTALIANEQGNTLASIYGLGKIEIFDFDRCTGNISSKDSIVVLDSNKLLYGLAFSPNSRFLYVSDQDFGSANRLRQYDLDASNLDSSFIVIWEQVNSPGPESIGALKLAPDGKIYLVHDGANPLAKVNMGIINDPDSADSLCNFSPYAFSLAPGRSRLGIPNIPNYNLASLISNPANAGQDQFLCQEDSIVLGVPDSTAGNNIYRWAPPYGLDDTVFSTATYFNSGVDTFYVLTVTDTTLPLTCNSTTDTVSIFHETPIDKPVLVDQVACPDESVEIGVTAISGRTYSWHPVSGLSNPFSSSTWVETAGDTMYTLTVVDTAYQTSCGLAKDSVRISIQPCYLPTVITTTDVSFIQKLEIPGLIEGTSLIIYDVQGKLLYKADNYKNDWPNQGDSMPNGMYVYVVEFPIDPKGPLGKREVRKLLIRN